MAEKMKHWHNYFRVFSLFFAIICVILLLSIRNSSLNNSERVIAVSILIAGFVFSIMTLIQREPDLIKTACKLIASFSIGIYLHDILTVHRGLFDLKGFMYTFLHLVTLVGPLVLSANSDQFRIFIKKRFSTGPQIEVVNNGATIYVVLSIIFMLLGLIGLLFRIFIPQPMNSDKAIAYLIGDNGSILRCAWIALSNIISWNAFLSLITCVLFILLSSSVSFIKRAKHLDLIQPRLFYFSLSMIISLVLLYAIIRTDYYSFCRHVTDGQHITAVWTQWMESQNSSVVSRAFTDSTHQLERIMFYIMSIPTTLVVFYLWCIIHFKSLNSRSDFFFHILVAPIMAIVSMVLLCASFRVISGLISLSFVAIAFVIVAVVLFSVLGAIGGVLLGTSIATTALKNGVIAVSELNPDNTAERYALTMIEYEKYGSPEGQIAEKKLSNRNRNDEE